MDKQYTRCPYCLTVFSIRVSESGTGNGEVRCGTCRKMFDVARNFVVQDSPGRYIPLERSAPDRREARSGLERTVQGGRTGPGMDGSDSPDFHTGRNGGNAAGSPGPVTTPDREEQSGWSAPDAADTEEDPAASAAQGSPEIAHNRPTNTGPERENAGPGIGDRPDEDVGVSVETGRAVPAEAGTEHEHSSAGAVGDRGGSPDVPAWQDGMNGNARGSAADPPGEDTGEGPDWDGQGYRNTERNLSMDDDMPARDVEDPDSVDGSNGDAWEQFGQAHSVPDETDTEPGPDSSEADGSGGSAAASGISRGAADEAGQYTPAVLPGTGTDVPPAGVERDNPDMAQDLPDGVGVPTREYEAQGTRHETVPAGEDPAEPAMSVPVEVGGEHADPVWTGGSGADEPANFIHGAAADPDGQDKAPALPEVDADDAAARDDGVVSDGPSLDDDDPSSPGKRISEPETEDNNLAELVRPSPPADGEKMVDLEITPEPVVGNWFNIDPDDTVERNPFEPVEATAPPDKGRPAQSNISMNGVDAYIADRPNPLAGLVWFIVALGFLFLLGLQVRTYFVDRYAQDERFRPYLSLFCRVAACELPARRDAYSFSITHTRVELHPDVPGALNITVKLVNQAGFSQPYPDLQLTLIDRVGRVIGRRTFSPDSYLGTDEPNLLESGELASVDFDLVQPNEKAVGFVVEIVLESAA